MAGSLLPEPKQQFLNDIGDPLFGGQVFTYAAGTLTPKATYQDQDLTILNTNPVIANARGEVLMFGDGSYRIILKDLFGNTIYDVDNIQSTSSLISSGNSALLSVLAASNGSSLIGFLQSGIGAVIQTLQQKNRQRVHIFDFLTDSQRQMAMDGIAFDAAPAIQAAIDAVCPLVGQGGRAGFVEFDPRYVLTVRTTINATNSRVNGTRSRDFLRLENMNLIGETGSGTAVIETTGSQWLHASGDIATVAGATASTVGLMQACSAVLPQTQNQTIDLRIMMHDDMTANGGAGTVGVWNFGAEENTYDSLYIMANVPLFATAFSTSPNYSSVMPTSLQAPLLASHSNGVNTFKGEQFLVSLGRHRPSLITENVNSFNMPSVYMSNIGSGGGNVDAWWQFGGFSGDVCGTIEQHCGLFITGAISGGSKIRVAFGGIFDANQPMLVFRRGSQGVLDDAEISIENLVSPNRQLFSAPPSSTNELISCFMRNVRISCNSDKQYINFPENMLWNPSTGNVVVEGVQSGGLLPYRYIIDGNRKARLEIPPTLVKVNGGITQAEIVRFMLPTIVSAANSLCAEITINGTASIVGSTTNAMSVRTLHATINVLVGNTGTIATGAAAIIASNQTDVNAAGNSITAVALTAGANVTYVALYIAPTTTGVNLESVQFTGTVEMTWNGNESRAPQLKIA